MDCARADDTGMTNARHATLTFTTSDAPVRAAARPLTSRVSHAAASTRIAERRAARLSSAVRPCRERRARRTGAAPEDVERLVGTPAARRLAGNRHADIARRLQAA